MAVPSDIIIIGAGPTGLIAAEWLARSGRRVAIHERMPSPARKFLMAGRGGLNLTHSEDLLAFLGRYGPARAFLEPALRAFTPQDLRDWAEGLGQKTFVGSSGRIFPESFKASPLLRAWLARLGELGVTLHARSQWTGWESEGVLAFKEADGSTTRLRPRATLLALGGASWPRLGSDGGWAPLLRAKGIGISELAPSNSGVEIRWSAVFREKFAGEPLKRIAVGLGEESRRGEAVITEQGLEGGVIYALSRPIREAIAFHGQARLWIDLRPDTDEGALVKLLARPRGGQSFSTFLRKALKLSPATVSLLREAAGNQLPDDAASLARLIKQVPLTAVSQRGLERAISTAGGVALAEIDRHYMLHKLPGVFVAGEMLDWEAPTGGYLLQACFASGIAAAKGIEAWLARSPGNVAP
ncbi:NAD(FAD)-utilizing dehydrogenase [Labrys miyagiensis]|uniref:NAD(FAD)-utilizing dehydrogenase n=1 Tax=Labrys miyagiensis TaxID=346912 RepID=A0ABQ6CJI7_9HYPH|nr:TIGR03862 family flavoprotein [Labrys miyagiensis]GLS20055.1 NAD(FAD)-utilizing dehydrogenase [Labrys miyagiensis]